MNLVAAFSASCVVVSLVYYLAASIIALRFASRARSAPPPLPKISPRVAVLKPLHGLSPSLPENLMTHLELDYRRVEYVFGVSSYDDPAADIPVALKPQYPFAQVTLAVGESPGCCNHKVAKLIGMAERAPRAEIFVISDADISVQREHLKRIVGELCADDKIGMVTCLYRAKPRAGFGSRLEALYVNTDFVPMVMVSSVVEPVRYGLGATIAVKREALEAIGGFRALKDLLADDYYLGKLVSERGYEVRLSPSIVTIKNDEERFADFWKRQIRWARTYRTTRPVSVATIVVHGPFWALMLLLATRFNPLALGLLAVVVGGRVLMSRLLIGRVLGLKEHRRDAWLVPLKDLIMTAVWAASLFSNEVLWGGRRLRIQSDGTMREVNG
ncbi:MAG TPA: bacteriohopanetetrol glucosamine biosynthesis glycosyltransferase HpnI [Candidatus Binataceae bacterium]|nr:bacteriohopanetetrol glucosamine biosynthesis glycosyltransferase HpnI [Candidatus Binataceae bacterium]